MKYSFLYLLIFLLPSWVMSQHDRCVTEHIHQNNKINKPDLYKSQEEFKEKLTKIIQQKKHLKTSAEETIYKIPVVVHIIHNNKNGYIGGPNNGNISVAQIKSQITILNEDYRKIDGTKGENNDPLAADVKIEFCLASIDPTGNYTSGITRNYNSKSEWNYYSFADEVELKKINYWPSDQYLNIWVTQLSNGVLGFAQYPSNTPLEGLEGNADDATIDGVVLDFRAFGKGGAAKSPYNLGRTATHEVGHWLGLFHIWGDASCGTDYVDDTPVDLTANNDLDCQDSSDCDGDLVYTPDLTNDYMDYSVDLCMNLFTVGQKDRMRTAMETSPRRKALLNSPGCCATSLSSMPVNEGFESTETNNPIWTEHYTNSAHKWDTITPGYLSAKSISIDNLIGSTNDSSFFISPFLKFNFQSPSLKFDVAYAKGTIAASDTLTISYSTGCNNWIPLKDFTADELITSSILTNNFIPGDNDWKTIQLDLTPLNNQPAGRIRFENISNQNGRIYLDNINIYNQKVYTNLEITPYPNPASDILSLLILLEGTNDFTIELYDVLGQKVFASKDFQQTSYKKEIDVSTIAKGIYILKVYSQNQSAAKRIFVNTN